MKMLRTMAALSLLLVPCSGASSGDESSRVLKQHAVWLQEGISWDRPEGETDPHRSYAAARLLYFGPDGKFGVFQGIVIKTRKSMALSEGDGEIVFGGEWKLANDEIPVSYRMVSWYKIMLREGQEQPVVPGEVLHGEIRLKKADVRSGSGWQVEFEGKKYEPEAGFKAPELRSHLGTHEQHPLGGQ
jgi:hypothetical protein